MIALKRVFSVVTVLTITGLGTFFTDVRNNLAAHLRGAQSEETTTTTIVEEPTTEPYLRPEGVHEAPDGHGKLVALTFDDGPSPISRHVLEAIDKTGGHATFFCLGDRAEEYQGILKKIVAQGSEIASHSYSHKRLTRLSDSALEDDLSMAADALEHFSGTAPTLMRPPYGAISDDMVGRIDMPVILWSIDSEDWRYCEQLCQNRSDEQRQRDFVRVVNSILDYVQDGDIVLMHDLYCFTQDVADAVIAELHHKGWKFVTVSELFEMKGMVPQPGVVYHCAR